MLLSSWFNCRNKYFLAIKGRSSLSEVFLGKGVLKICSQFRGEHPCRGAISIMLLCNFIVITLRHGCPPVNLQHIFRTPFPKNTSGGLLLKGAYWGSYQKSVMELFMSAYFLVFWIWKFYLLQVKMVNIRSSNVLK